MTTVGIIRLDEDEFGIRATFVVNPAFTVNNKISKYEQLEVSGANVADALANLLEEMDGMPE